ncbi:MAG: response regulator transcription factor [Anaerolineales bacterium]|nr:response regulator transcription factor [Anaerolineales bacterium]MCL4258205.1 response regulator transcription factor [Anaerolineales bacterium]
MPKISVVVVEDHPIFRQGLIDSFALEKDLNVIGQASEGNEGLTLIKKLLPDVAVLDVNLPNINGQQLTRQLKGDKKVNTRVVLLTAYDDSSQVIHAMASGAAAYCVKDIDPAKLVDIVRAVASGSFVVGEQVMDQGALQRWLGERGEISGRAYSDPGDPFEPLSSREMEVLECVTRGMSNKEIATHLDISHQTVKNHVTAVLRKLNVEDRTQAAVYALRRGWVRL